MRGYWTEVHQIFIRPMKLSRPISPILPKMLSLSISLKRSKNEGHILNLQSNIYHMVKNVVKIGPVDPDIICFKRSLKMIDAEYTQMSLVKSGVTRPKFTKFLSRCSRSWPLLMHPSALRYSNPLWNAKVTTPKVSRRFCRLKPWNWLPWHLPPNERKKKVGSIIYDQIPNVR